MRRLFCVVAVMVAVMLPVYAAGQDKPAAKAAAPATKMLRASGSITAVSTDSLTIKAKSEEMTFAVDAKTKVTGPGASTKTTEAKAAGKTTVLTDFVKVGDMVTVNYHETDGTKHAAGIRITNPAKPVK